MELVKRLESFSYALAGLVVAWREEINLKIESALAVIALASGWYFGVTKLEWLIIVIAIGLVLAAETFNTALEELCDKFQPTHDPHIAKIKDLAAAAVLITSITALVVGLIIFLPHLSALL